MISNFSFSWGLADFVTALLPLLTIRCNSLLFCSLCVCGMYYTLFPRVACRIHGRHTVSRLSRSVRQSTLAAQLFTVSYPVFLKKLSPTVVDPFL